jgi:lipid II:glycine glycyltransferase (peptidoglycan interpeptide bridge formation enzyme)
MGAISMRYMHCFCAQPGFASIYACIRDGRVMNAIIVLRDKDTSLNMSGGLDVSAVYQRIATAQYLHYFAMQQEFYKWGTQQYDFVYSASGGVAEFKQSFNPEHTQQPAPVTVVFKKRQYKLYSLLLLRYAQSLKKLGRRLAGK